ncbi:hypothetical protein Pmani_014837 [Petrolisthes manimaculis]|uniref:DUF7041 domain-containing protein n=1 Tax=Petrolisthes manimaculis TaxID=1843537 RepID=A0AAE1UAK3_9EUCA|nr:hypothetical protein Pmani_014837 [Petrolisthes manimaculis]
MSEPQDISDTTPTISNFRAPSFSHDHTLWFIILEVNFRAHRITSCLKKFSAATALLPPEVHSQLSDSVTAAFTNEFMDTIPNETNICNITSYDEISQLKDLISSLAVQVNELKLQVQQQSPAYPLSPRRHRSRSRDSRNTYNSTNSNSNGMYYYHHRFGNNAHHCQQP